MQHYLIIRQSPKPPVRSFPCPQPRPGGMAGRLPIATRHLPFPILRDCVIGTCLSRGAFWVCITSFATNTPRPAGTYTAGGEGTQNRRKGSPPPALRFATLRPWSSPTRAGTFPPDSVSVCVSVCSQPPGGSIPPILRADCLTRRGQVPLPKTLSPPTHSLFLFPADPLRDRRPFQVPHDFPRTGPRTSVRLKARDARLAAIPPQEPKRTEVRAPVHAP